MVLSNVLLIVMYLLVAMNARVYACWPLVKDCLIGMLRWDPAHRFTADEVLDHPWLKVSTVAIVLLLPANVFFLIKPYFVYMQLEKNNM